jgi:hypothetical protein
MRASTLVVCCQGLLAGCLVPVGEDNPVVNSGQLPVDTVLTDSGQPPVCTSLPDAGTISCATIPSIPAGSDPGGTPCSEVGALARNCSGLPSGFPLVCILLVCGCDLQWVSQGSVTCPGAEPGSCIPFDIPDGGWGSRPCGSSVCAPTQLCVDVPPGPMPACVDVSTTCPAGTSFDNSRCQACAFQGDGCCWPEPHCVDSGGPTSPCATPCNAACFGGTTGCPVNGDVCLNGGGVCTDWVDGGYVQCENA